MVEDGFSEDWVDFYFFIQASRHKGIKDIYPKSFSFTETFETLCRGESHGFLFDDPY